MQTHEEVLAEMAADREKRQPIVDALLKADPKLSPVIAYVIASDQLSKQWVWDEVEKGTTPILRAVWLPGSYARMDFVLEAIDRNAVQQEALYPILPELWRGSDPDDTDHRFHELWLDAWEAHGHRVITDGKRLPPGKYLTVYRGQDADAPAGIAWTLDKKIAEKFARGAATRQSNRGGTVYIGRVRRQNIIAFLTGRGESECIISPWHVETPDDE